MGNITSLKRFQGNATTAIDQLVYTYANSGKSNQLSSVADTSNNDLGQLGGTTSYGYDPNGNLQSDNKKQLTFKYNFLNLPDTIIKTGTGAGTIAYIYDANGKKLRKAMTGANRDYINGIEYNSTGVIEFIQTEEGRARPNGGSYFYEYALKDHLGNTRVLIGQDGMVSQQTDYCAFGMELNRGTNIVPSPDNKYKYNGKELQGELGMNLYDYGARFYDPVIARWLVVDPLAEKMRRYSPYNYGIDDPIRFIDPDGMQPEWLKGANAKVNKGRATYKVNKDGTLTWINATVATKKLGNNLVAHGGLKDLNIARDSKHEIDLNYSLKAGPNGHLGETATRPDKPGSTTTDLAIVTVFQGSLDNNKKNIQGWGPMPAGFKTDDNYNNQKSMLQWALVGLHDDAAILAGVTDHELFHASDEENIKNSLSKNVSVDVVEEPPTRRENELYKRAIIKDVINIALSQVP
jgi:RHS repeat-associated protein